MARFYYYREPEDVTLRPFHVYPFLPPEFIVLLCYSFELEWLSFLYCCMWDLYYGVFGSLTGEFMDLHFKYG